MANSRKNPRTVKDETYSKLDEYCIWLNEYYCSLRKAGFKDEIALYLITDKNSYPQWVAWQLPTDAQIAEYMDEEDED